MNAPDMPCSGDIVAAHVRGRVEELAAAKGLPPSGMCLQHAAYGWEALRDYLPHDARIILQGGSATWPRLRPEDDDGVIGTHFGYEWSDGPATSIAILTGNFSAVECHFWLGVLQPGSPDQLVDFTTWGLPTQARITAGLDWPGITPPPYLWSHKLPDGWGYRAARGAVEFGYHALLSSPMSALGMQMLAHAR